MNNLKRILRIGYPGLKTEFLIIFSWLLLAPDKVSLSYHLISASLILFLIFKEFYHKKHFESSTYSAGIILFILILTFSQLFSLVPFTSLLSIADLILVGFFFLQYPADQTKESLFSNLLYIISFFSLVIILNEIFAFTDPTNLFFINPIVKAAFSSIGLLISFYKMLHRNTILLSLHFSINLCALYLLGSKSAFLASIIIIFLIFFKKRKKYLKYLLLIILLTIVIPNPVKKSFIFFIKKDPYALERINIYKSGLKIFLKYFPVGIGLDNYSKVSPQFNFKTEYAPANYLKYPRRTHNDFIQILCEIGLIGLLSLLLASFFLIKKFFSSGLSLPFSILFLILIQAFFYNIIFKLPIFFLILLLIKLIPNNQIKFISFPKISKIILSIFLLSLYFLLHVFPFISSNLQKKAIHSKTPLKYLNRASLYTPQDYNIYFKKAQKYLKDFQQNPTWSNFILVNENISATQRLNKYFKASYLLKSRLFLILAQSKNMRYALLEEEIINPLLKVEKYFPFDPFIKFQKSLIYHQFLDFHQAKLCAEAALQVEPKFISALWYLYKNSSKYNNQNTLLKLKTIVKNNNLPYNGNKIYLKHLFFLPNQLLEELSKNEIK
jgi:O-antigen ligase